MALNNANVLRGVTGLVSAGPTGTAAPTTTISALDAAFVDLGWVSEDGVTKTFPDGGDADPLRGWQNNAVIETIRTPSEDNPTFQFVLLETKKEVIEAALGVTVAQTSTEGSYTLDTQAARGRKAFVIDVLHGAKRIRDHVPQGYVTEIGDQVYANGEAIGYDVTIDAERDSALGYNVKTWSTQLKTA